MASEGLLTRFDSFVENRLATPLAWVVAMTNSPRAAAGILWFVGTIGQVAANLFRGDGLAAGLMVCLGAAVWIVILSRCSTNPTAATTRPLADSQKMMIRPWLLAMDVVYVGNWFLGMLAGYGIHGWETFLTGSVVTATAAFYVPAHKLHFSESVANARQRRVIEATNPLFATQQPPR